jgi:flagellar biosynthesis protein FliR
MNNRSIFNAKTASEIVAVTFDFASEYAVGETCTSASVTAVVYSGADPDASSLVATSPSLSQTRVTQTLTGGVAGVTYSLTATALSSAGKTRSMTGFVSVV